MANVVRGAVAVDPFSAEALRSLRALVSLAVARVEQERDTGLKAVRQALSRWSPVQILAVVCLLIAVVIVVGLQLQGANTRRGRDFTGLFARASSRQGAGDHAGAAELFNAAIAVLPDTERTADAWNDLGWSLLMLNKDDDAIAAFRKALMLKPAFPRARNNLEVAQRKIDLKKAGAASQPTPR
ncbi:MAG: tetratricopeptide repeat protein [Deltaproteobacteria bacterium]|nr:tetratricopeptide repeat protein [Deltaproteobacteria bacterium]